MGKYIFVTPLDEVAWSFTILLVFQTHKLQDPDEREYIKNDKYLKEASFNFLLSVTTLQSQKWTIFQQVFEACSAVVAQEQLLES